MKSGNYTSAPQFLYILWNVPYIWVVKIGIGGKLRHRTRQVGKSAPGLDIPVRLAWLPGAYYIEQAIHSIFFLFRLWSWGRGAGRTEWFIALPGVVWVLVYAIIQWI